MQPQPTREPPRPDPDPAHAEPGDDRPNPGDPGPEIPAPRTRTDPVCDPRIPIDAPPPSRGV